MATALEGGRHGGRVRGDGLSGDAVSCNSGGRGCRCRPTDRRRCDSTREGPGRAPGQLHRLPIVAQDEWRHSFPDRRGSPPLKEPLVPGPLNLVQLREHRIQSRRPLLLPDISTGRARFRPLKHSGFKVYCPVRLAPVNEELRLRSQNLSVRKVPPQDRVIENARGRIPAYRQDARFYNRHGSTQRQSQFSRDQGSALDPASASAPAKLTPFPPDSVRLPPLQLWPPVSGTVEQNLSTTNAPPSSLHSDLQQRRPRATASYDGSS